MRCQSCDHDYSSARRFCGECGAALAALCAACGASNGPSEKFCGGCGAALTAGLATAPTRSPATSTPKHLAEKILQSKTALEGERKQVTVLFADVKGSMELAEQLDPEEWNAIMHRRSSRSKEPRAVRTTSRAPTTRVLSRGCAH